MNFLYAVYAALPQNPDVEPQGDIVVEAMAPAEDVL